MTQHEQFNEDLHDAELEAEVEAEVDEDASLNYQQVRGEKDKPKSAPRVGGFPVAGAAGAGGLALGGGAAASAQPQASSALGDPLPAEIRFDQQQLSAAIEVDSSGRILDDPWGTEDDEYAVPGAVTGAEDDRDNRQRGSAGGMALRGSGTRGGASGPQAASGGMMPMAPGATVGGVGGPAAAQAGSTQAMSAAAGGGGQMPLTLLQQQAQTSTHATKAVAGTAAYAPAGGGTGSMSGFAGVAAAGSEGYDSARIKAILDAEGFDPRAGLDSRRAAYVDADGRFVDASADLVDSDGDGIPDAPRDGAKDKDSQNSRTSGPLAAGAGMFIPGASTASSTAASSSMSAPPPSAGAGTWGSSSTFGGSSTTSGGFNAPIAASSSPTSGYCPRWPRAGASRPVQARRRRRRRGRPHRAPPPPRAPTPAPTCPTRRGRLRAVDPSGGAAVVLAR